MGLWDVQSSATSCTGRTCDAAMPSLSAWPRIPHRRRFRIGCLSGAGTPWPTALAPIQIATSPSHQPQAAPFFSIDRVSPTKISLKSRIIMGCSELQLLLLSAQLLEQISNVVSMDHIVLHLICILHHQQQDQGCLQRMSLVTCFLKLS